MQGACERCSASQTRRSGRPPPHQLCRYPTLSQMMLPAGEDTAGEDTAGEDSAGEDTAGEDTAGDAAPAAW